MSQKIVRSVSCISHSAASSEATPSHGSHNLTHPLFEANGLGGNVETG